MRRFPRRVLALCLALVTALLVSACASIPESGAPKKLRPGGGTGQGSEAAQPERGLTPLGLVRNFVKASADSEQLHAAARLYLTEQASRSWDDRSLHRVIADDFDTIPRQVLGPNGEPKPNEQIVVLRGTQFGRVDFDASFVPETKSIETELRVEKQANGDWRIADPPQGVVVTFANFKENYKQVRVYFSDPNHRTVVPDLRYVPMRPARAVPDKVLDALLLGPSAALRGSVTSVIPQNTALASNVSESADGALQVNLGKLGDKTTPDRRVIAAQVVLSLRQVTNSRIKLFADGQPLVQDKLEWRPADVATFEAHLGPSPELAGMYVMGGKLRSLKDESLVAAAGELGVVSAAQSKQGDLLAVVARQGGGVQLRVGPTNGPLREVSLRQSSTLTRPTWMPDAPEMWTVLDQSTVVRVVDSTGRGTWSSARVNADELTRFGAITELRLSRDGLRVAAIAGGRLVVGTVAEQGGERSVRAAQVLGFNRLSNPVAVEWPLPDALIVATTNPTTPVAKIGVDGLVVEPYLSSNLTPPVHAIAAAPSRPVVVSDSGGLWKVTESSEVWQPLSFNPGPNAVPFYPG
ncbi:LpqB family beta-propeller domain-containing protein [Allokutzneria multivorans]|uniref:LpqB family beta-propeller domain-containing protein n=1 Tax=Allokutzneria multivorans TaxID=1142134 RepID=A0ABP7R1V3_9PSEU